MYDLLASAINHPDSQHPYRGLFNKRSLESISKHDDVSLTAFSPIPYAPPFGPKSEFRKVPVYEKHGEYSVIRPRFFYFLPKKYLYALTGESFSNTLKRETNDLEPDMAHACHVFPDGYALRSIAKMKEIPFTITCHGHFLNNIGNLPPGIEKRVRSTIRAADHVFCVSDALSTKAKIHSDRSRVSTIPIGADPSNFPTEERENLKKKFCINNKTVILFCGQFIRRKGIEEVIDALPRLPKEGLEYVFIGHSGDMKEEFSAAVNDGKSPRNVRVLESVPTNELREWFAMADIFFLPSHKEGRPTVLYEAMASNTAILATDIPGVREQVVDGKTGWLIPPKDPQAIADAISQLSSDSELVQNLADNGKAHLTNMGWTWDNYANRVVEIHKEIVEHERKR